MTRVSLLLLVVACGDAVPQDEAHTCVVLSVNDFGTEEAVSTMFEPGKPTRATVHRDGQKYAHWDFTYDSDHRVVLMQLDQRFDGETFSTWRYEHSPTMTIELVGSTFSETVARVEHTIDADDRVVRSLTASSATAYELDERGAILRMFSDGVDEGGMRQQATSTYRYANGRLVELAIVSSFGPMFPGRTWTYEESTGQLVVHTGSSTYTYTYDAAGRTTRLDTDRLVVEFEYALDGAVAVRAIRDGAIVKTTTLSAACGYRPDLPGFPRSGRRPGTHWFFGEPGFPQPY